MKPVLDLLAASALSVGLVIGGVMAVSAALSPQKQQHRFTGLDSGDLWTSKPVRIDRSDQTLERLPPRDGSQVVTGEPTTASRPSALAPEREEFVPQEKAVDLVATGAIHDVPADMAPPLPPEHVSWCSKHYRSYRVEDNAYQPHGGGPRRQCDLASFSSTSIVTGTSVR